MHSFRLEPVFFSHAYPTPSSMTHTHWYILVLRVFSGRGAWPCTSRSTSPCTVILVEQRKRWSARCVPRDATPWRPWLLARLCRLPTPDSNRPCGILGGLQGSALDEEQVDGRLGQDCCPQPNPNRTLPIASTQCEAFALHRHPQRDVRLGLAFPHSPGHPGVLQQ